MHALVLDHVVLAGMGLLAKRWEVKNEGERVLIFHLPFFCQRQWGGRSRTFRGKACAVKEFGERFALKRATRTRSRSNTTEFSGVGDPRMDRRKAEVMHGLVEPGLKPLHRPPACLHHDKSTEISVSTGTHSSPPGVCAFTSNIIATIPLIHRVFGPRRR